MKKDNSHKASAPLQPEHKEATRPEPKPEQKSPLVSKVAGRKSTPPTELPPSAVAEGGERDVLQHIRETFEQANHRNKLFMGSEDLERLRVQLSKIDLLPIDERYIRTQPIPDGALYNIDGIWVFEDNKMESRSPFRLERDDNPA